MLTKYLYIFLLLFNNAKIVQIQKQFYFEFKQKYAPRLSEIISVQNESVYKDMKVSIELIDLSIKHYHGEIIYKNNKYEFNVSLIDTTPPKFVSDHDTFEFELNKDYDVYSLFEIEESSKYQLHFKDTIDFKKEGTYKTSVYAIDEYGNRSEKKITYIIKNNAVKKDVIPNTPMIKQENIPNKPDICVSNGTWKTVGNSGFATYSYDEAYEYAFNHTPLDHGAFIYSIEDICGKEGWSVQWYKLDD